MKKVFMSFCALMIVFGAYAFSGKPAGKGDLKASEIMIPIGNHGQSISLLQLSKISRGDLENLTGRKMNLAERFAFKGAQKKLKNSINSEGNVTNKKVKKFFNADGTSNFNLGGFALGLLLGLIGVLIAYLINDGNKSSRIKWSWIGLAVWIALVVVVVVL